MKKVEFIVVVVVVVVVAAAAAAVVVSGLEWRSRYSDWLRAGQSGDRIPVGARFSALVLTGPGAYPASYTMGTGSLPEVKRPGSGTDQPPSFASRLKKE